jgi:hypothetical protein
MAETTIDLGLEFDFGPERPDLAADGKIRTQLETITINEPHMFDGSEQSNPVTKMFRYLESQSDVTRNTRVGHFAGTQPAQVAIVTQSSGDAMLYIKPDVQTRYPNPAVAHHLRRDDMGAYTLVASMLAKDLSEVRLRPEQPVVYGWAAKEVNQATIITKEGGVLHDFYKTMQGAADTNRKSRLGRFFTRR